MRSSSPAPSTRTTGRFLRDHGQVLVEKYNFAYVAVTQEQQAEGFTSGKYGKGFSEALTIRFDTTHHYGA